MKRKAPISILSPTHTPPTDTINMQDSSNCPHLTKVRPFHPGTEVHKEECTKCFHKDTDEGGIVVCLTCFTGGCQGRGHAALHAVACNHPVGLHLQRREKEPEQKEMVVDEASGGAAATAGPVKMAIGVPGGFQQQSLGEKEYELVELLCSLIHLVCSKYLL